MDGIFKNMGGFSKMLMEFQEYGWIFKNMDVFSEIWIFNFGGENVHYSKNTTYVEPSRNKKGQKFC